MPIPSSIETAFTKQYGPMLMMLSQQKGSKMVSKVSKEIVVGATEAFFDLLGEADSEEITTRHPTTPINEIPNTRRRVGLTSIHTNAPLDHLDKLQIMIEPTSKYALAQAWALGRQMDDRIINAALGSAGAGVDGTTPVPFKDDSISISGDGTATTLGTLATPQTEVDMTLAKMLLMLNIFNTGDVDPDIRRYWMVTPKTISDMLDLTEVGSADYNIVKALVQGKVEFYMGFNWFWSNRTQKDTTDQTTFRSLAWAEDGLIFATWEDVFNRVSERADISYMIQVYSRMTNGAVRMEGKKVHECLNKVL